MAKIKNPISYVQPVKTLGGEYNLESVELEDGTQKMVATKAGVVTSDVVTSGKYFVKVIDYDGTVLKEVNASAGDVITLPNAPSHDGLVFQEWSCSQEIVDRVITVANRNVMAGAVYTTVSGLNEFDIELTKVTGLVVDLLMDGVKDWGDGTSDDLTTHAYTAYGKYTIKCNGTTMTTDSGVGCFGQKSGVVNYYCTSVRLATVTSIADYAFSYCYSLTNITIPDNVAIIGYSVFNNCRSLISITLPNSVISIGDSAFYYCYSLISITLPNNVTNIGSNTFRGCCSLAKIVMPSNVDIIEGYTCSTCYSLASITLPNDVTSIGSNAFSSCNCMVEYDFSKCTSVPTLSNTNAFSGRNAIAKIIVPDALYDEWIVATNWASIADYIYKANEVNV